MATTVSLKPNAVEISGSTSGTTTLQATAVAGTTTLTLPAATDTLVGKATTDTLTNKTLTSPTITGTLTTTGNTILGDASTDTLNVGNGDLVKDASGNLGIGTTSPSTSNTSGASFVPGTSTVASMTGSNGSGQLLLGNNGNGSNLATNDSCGMIAFKGRFNSTFAGGNDIASIIGTYTGNGTTRSGAIRFLTLDSGTEAERARIDSSGNVTLQNNISVGGAAPTTSGTGITFPATQSASSNANTLDDYEEGTWTPVATNLTVVGSVSYVATYTKIGRVVYINLKVNATTSSTSTSNSTYFDGLPFEPAINSTVTAVSEANIASLGVGMFANGARLFAPSWTAVANATLSGFYYV